ncbi:hypothetical protein BS329_35400 [Amycolatopsis coloradensis]|uniref:Uncharacterized protein n=1 Tax=Amycolatopsis coloradensis TaxID=76021 RepID=A0A1R0KH86_9PSEU|nr:hypothetical protein [Amycolatopsis coloradensis]OLZ45037.1 hypothetical protein BS329_35400 [Amycolatopsis coloradensis]
MIAVLAGVIGALFGFSGALLGAWIKSRGEQQRWLRDQKLTGAAELVSAGTNIFELRHGNKVLLESFEPGELREWQTQLQKNRAAIHLLCAQETRDHADAFVKSCWRAKTGDREHKDKTIAALRAFTTSLRKEIGSE